MPIAREYAEAGKSAEDGPELIFFTGKQAGGIVPRVRQLAGLKGVPSSPQMIILDIPDNGAYYQFTGPSVNASTVRDFLNGFKSKSLERKQLSRG